jgi:hypothetical protein
LKIALNNNNIIMPTASYNFDQELLKRSTSNNIDDARKEWVFLESECQPRGTILCICGNKNIQYIYYFFNAVTGAQMIATGEVCAKKLGLRFERGSGRINVDFKEFLFEYRAIYTNLDDLVYGDLIKHKFLEFVDRRIMLSANLNEAYLFVKGLVDMFHSYNHQFIEIQVKCDELKVKIDEKEAERLEMERQKEIARLKMEEERRIYEENRKIQEQEQIRVSQEKREKVRIENEKAEADREKRRELIQRRIQREREEAEYAQQRLIEEARERDRLEREEAERKDVIEYQRRRRVEEERRENERRMSLMREIRNKTTLIH